MSDEPEEMRDLQQHVFLLYYRIVSMWCKSWQAKFQKATGIKHLRLGTCSSTVGYHPLSICVRLSNQRIGDDVVVALVCAVWITIHHLFPFRAVFVLFWLMQWRERPYQHDSTASRLLSGVKHVRAWLVLRRGTTLVSQVLFSFWIVRHHK
jgi:hypothetical protein